MREREEIICSLPQHFNLHSFLLEALGVLCFKLFFFTLTNLHNCGEFDVINFCVCQGGVCDSGRVGHSHVLVGPSAQTSQGPTVSMFLLPVCNLHVQCY